MTLRPIPISPRQPESTAARAKRWHSENAELARTAAVGALARGAEFQAQCGEVADLGDLLPPGFADRARRLSDYLAQEIAALTFLVQKGSFR